MPLEDLPRHEGMRRPHVRGYNAKELNENLAPLRRFLMQQVGRPWDKIFSEIARHLKPDSTVQQHVRNHLDDFVAINPIRQVTSAYNTKGERSRREHLWYQPLYVDPRDGLLKRTDKLPEEKARRERRRQFLKGRSLPDRVSLAIDRELRCIDGLWFEVAVAALPEPEYRAFKETVKVRLTRYRDSRTVEMEMRVRRLVAPPVHDAVSGALVPVGPHVDNPENWAEYRRLHPDGRYAVAKRSLSHAELKRHGLRNLPKLG